MLKWVGYFLVGMLVLGGIGSMLGVESEETADSTKKPSASKSVEPDKPKKTEPAALVDLPDETTTQRAAEPTPSRTTRSTPKPTRTRSPKPPRVVQKSDPMFDTCGDANDAGYGNYVRGSDPEYDWYDDRDGDGRVCEF